MKTLIIGAGPLGSLYAYRLHAAGHDVTLLARGEHYTFVKENGLQLVNAFTGERMEAQVPVTDTLCPTDRYDLVIVLMRKNSVRALLPQLGRCPHVKTFLFMGNNAAGFNEYLRYLPQERVLFGFPGGGGARIGHEVHFVDSEQPNGKRMGVTLGEMDGKMTPRLRRVERLFESAGVPVQRVAEINGWLKYHAVFVNPLAGALISAGDNHALAADDDGLLRYIRAVKEGSRVLAELGYTRSYNSKLRLFSILPEHLTVRILKKAFATRFAEVAMMMHVNAAQDEMQEIAAELAVLSKLTKVKTENLDALRACLTVSETEQVEYHDGVLQ